MTHFVFSHKKALATTSLCVVTSIGAFAQDVTVKGIIKDASGMPIIGANIVEKGTTNGVISDFDGKFEMKVKQGTTLVVSFIGYIPQEFAATSGKPMVIILQDNTVNLEEAVVIGYGTVKKSDATGSVVSIKADQMNKGVVSNPIEMLQGKTPGVQITGNSGAPGEGATIRIRGGSSMSASNDPLIVVDGLPMSNTNVSGMKNALSTINPNDIESFTVLKDASATAIYGSRASNGVILITTKKGTQGQGVQVNADVSFSVSYLADKVDVLDAAGLMNVVEQVKGLDSDAYRALGYTGANGERAYANTKWQDEIYQTAFSEEANVSVNGNVKQVGILNALPYRVSGGFINQDGILKTSNMKKGTASFNLTPTMFDEHLRVNLNGKGMYIHNRFANADAVGAAVRYDPTKPVYSNVAGESLNGYTAWMNNETETNNMASLNPVAMLNDKVDKSNVYRFIGNAQVDYKFHFLPEMRANVNVGLDYSHSKGYVETPVDSEISKHDKTQLGSGVRTDYKQTRRDETLEAYLAYNPNLESINSKFDVLAGYSWQHFWKSEHTIDVKNSDRNVVLYEKPYKTENYLVSFFGRLNYSFMDKYFLTASVREDGSSRFKNNKWGFFPSAAFAWRVINENFMSNATPVMSDLKLRLGYGKTGQQDGIGDYGAFPTYKNHLPGSYYMFGNQLITPVTPLGYATNLRWEETETYNIGLDYGFWNNRITGTADFYYRKTNDLLNYVPEAAGTNLKNYILKNVGNMENKGVELGVNIIAIDKKDWTWDLSLNYTWNKNKITKLTANSDPDYVGEATGGISGGVGNNIQIQQVGQPMNSFYVFQQVYGQDGRPIEGEYVDRNGDGIVNDKDKYVYHKAAPDVYLGFNTNLRYKKWTLSIAARAAFGNYVYDNVTSNNSILGDLWTNGFLTNQMSTTMWYGTNQAQYMSDMYVKRADYFKLDKVTLSYDFTNYLRVFATGQNLVTASKYKGLDPEIGNGIDNNMYPRPTTFVIGASYTF